MKKLNPIKNLFAKLHIPKPRLPFKLPNINWPKLTKLHKLFDKMEAFALLLHALLAMLVCFSIECLSQHALSEGISYVKNHTGAFIYCSFIIFATYNVVFLLKRRAFLRWIITAFYLGLGAINCVVLLNRVTPFGFTDMSMISDLLTMQNTNYFTAQQAMVVVALIVIFIICMVILFLKGHRVTNTRFPLWAKFIFVIGTWACLPFITTTLEGTGVLSAYFGNLAQGYRDYGFIYGFSASVFNRGMSRPSDYSYDTIQEILAETSQGDSTIDTDDMPNIIVVLLESFYDVSEANFIETSEDPTPYFHYLEENYSTGYLTVPVVGAGTCNSEFEVLTGMSCTFFGPGEYPQKTILKKVDSCESFASALSVLGYSSHVVHNNGGNFYSRANAFSKMGFDTFQCKEMLDITDYTPLGSWPTDDILIDATVEALKSTEGSDFVYTITVEAHGDYPTYEVESDPAISVTCNGKTEEQTYAWSYYINRIHDVDQFIEDYIAALSELDEDTLVIFFGDHLPTMGLAEDEIATGNLYLTKYITWNNFGMEKDDKDLTSYQLVSEYLDRLGIHEGTITNYHQSMLAEDIEAGTSEYMTNLELLQYDLLYGDKFAYDGDDLYLATDLEMGISDVVIERCYTFGGYLHIYGTNFTKWSKVYVNGSKVATTYVSGQHLKIKLSLIENGDEISVCQVGSSNTIFRESNIFTITNYLSAD